MIVRNINIPKDMGDTTVVHTSAGPGPWYALAIVAGGGAVEIWTDSYHDQHKVLHADSTHMSDHWCTDFETAFYVKSVGKEDSSLVLIISKEQPPVYFGG